MHSSTTYAIYWIPSGAAACGGSPCQVSASYESLIDRYFTDVAAASGRNDNVYSVATQYSDSNGPLAYQSSFGGSYVDTSAFPPSGCNDGTNAVCLTDRQIQDEIQNVLTAKGWQGSTTNVFFVMTPDGVGSCFDGTDQACTTNTYCAYHSYFLDANNEPVIYGNEPYDATISGCDPGSSPNNDAADAAINTLSHEHNEAITDPFGNAWWNVDSDQENGDNCAWIFGTPLGGTPGVDEYNQVVNGHHYWLQEEWSNDGSACAQRYPFEVPVNATPPTVSGTAAEGRVLSATSGAWSQAPTSYTYQWLRCSSPSETSCFSLPGGSGPTYELVAADVGKMLRVAVYANNAVGTSTAGVSAPTAAVVPLPAATAVPVISGVAAVGKTLSTTAGTWNTPATYTYQWLRCTASGTGCTAVGGATGTDFSMLDQDAGHTLEVVVSATNAAGTTQALSKRSALVVSIPRVKKAPHISGKARVGRRLVAVHGSWVGPPKSYRYRWFRCNGRGGSCRSIEHATHATYRLTRADGRHRLRVRVTGTNAAGRRSATSRATARVP